MLVVRGDSPMMRVEDLVVRAKSNPGKLSDASGAIGDPAHLASATLLAVTAREACPSGSHRPDQCWIVGRVSE